MLVFISKTSIDVGKMMLDEAKVLERKEDPTREEMLGPWPKYSSELPVLC